MLAQLFVHNYKGFVNFQLQCGRIVFLMGPNGSGKSSLVEVIHALAMVINDGAIEDFFEADSRFRFAEFAGQRYDAHVQLGGRMFQYKLELGFEGREERPVVRREELTADDKRLFLFQDGVLHLHNDFGQEKASFPFDRHKGGLAIVESRPENQRLTEFKKWANGFLLLKLNPAAIEPEARKAADFLSTDGSNFTAWYEIVANADTQFWLEYLRAMQEAIPGLTTINLKPLPRHGKLWEGEFQFGGVKKSFGLDELSDGQISLIVLYAILHFCVRRGMTVALDEPDNYLALAEIEPFLYALEDAAEENAGQAFVISHHPEIYSRWALDPERCRYLERAGDGRFLARSIDWGEHPGLTPAEVVARGWQGG